MSTIPSEKAAGIPSAFLRQSTRGTQARPERLAEPARAPMMTDLSRYRVVIGCSRLPSGELPEAQDESTHGRSR
jgi:hypothetical protein